MVSGRQQRAFAYEPWYCTNMETAKKRLHEKDTDPLIVVSTRCCRRRLLVYLDPWEPRRQRHTAVVDMGRQQTAAGVAGVDNLWLSAEERMDVDENLMTARPLTE